MPRFEVEAVLSIEADGIEALGGALRRLTDAASAAGFELQSAKATPADERPEPDDGWTGYGPPIR